MYTTDLFTHTHTHARTHAHNTAAREAVCSVLPDRLHGVQHFIFINHHHHHHHDHVTAGYLQCQGEEAMAK